MNNSEKKYLLVWGDTVHPQKLLLGVILGITLALVGLYGGKALIGQLIADPTLAKTASLVTGLLGCVLAGVLTAKIVPPSRKVVEDSHNADRIAQTMAEIKSEKGGLGLLTQASELSQQELSDADLVQWFVNEQHLDAKGGDPE